MSVCVAAMMTLVPGIPVCDSMICRAAATIQLRHRNQVAHDYRYTRPAVIKHRGLGENIMAPPGFVFSFVIVAGQGNAKQQTENNRNGSGAKRRNSALQRAGH